MAKTKAESLVDWLISVVDGEVHCSRLADLSTGSVLAMCLKQLSPNCNVSDEGKPFTVWTSILSMLEDFCGCSLASSISVRAIVEKDEEQIGRAVVLVLCLAVRERGNERCIDCIMSLELDTQRDLMFFIEEATAKMNTQALAVGKFTSGIGELLPCLDVAGGEEDPGFTPTNLSPKRSFLASIPPSSSVRTALFQDERLSASVKPRGPSTNLLGLYSPAAAKWLCSPAISRMTLTPAASNYESKKLREELIKLQHKTRVLESSLETETKLAKEFYNDLCQKTTEYGQLETKYFDLQVKSESLKTKEKDQQDLADEVEAYKEKLKDLTKYKEKAEKLLEQERGISVKVKSGVESQQEKLENLSHALIEQRAKCKQSELQLETCEIKLRAKEEHLLSSLKQLEEVSEELSCTKKSLKEIQASEKEVLEAELNSAKEEANSKDVELAEARGQVAILKQEMADKMLAKQEEVMCLEAKLRKLEGELEVTNASMQKDKQIEQELQQEMADKMLAKQEEVMCLEAKLRKLEGELEATNASMQKDKQIEQELQQEMADKMLAKQEEVMCLEAKLRKLEGELEVTNASMQKDKQIEQELQQEVADKMLAKQEEVMCLEAKLRKLEGELEVTNASMQKDKQIEQELQQEMADKMLAKQEEVMCLEAKLEGELKATNASMQKDKQIEQELQQEMADKMLAKQEEVMRLEAKLRKLEGELEVTNASMQKDKQIEQELQQEMADKMLAKQEEVMCLEAKLEGELKATNASTQKDNQIEQELQQTKLSLVREQSTVAKLSSEKRSLEAQLDLASRKLREKETARCSTATGLKSPSRTTANQRPLSREVEFSVAAAPLESKQEDLEGRLKELQERNAKVLPHLKSSYPIEFQCTTDCPSLSNKSIKLGADLASTSKSRKRLLEVDQGGVAFDVTLSPPKSGRPKVPRRLLERHTSRPETKRAKLPAKPVETRKALQNKN